jgi:DNA-binding NarL/FixJ family response regulator
MTPKKIVVCEDHALFADGLRVLLSFYPEFQLVGQATDAHSLNPLLTAGVDVLLLDLNLGKNDGFTLLETIRHSHPHVKVLILTMYEDEFLIEKARKLGAHGYLLKNANNHELVEAINSLSVDDFYLPPSLKQLASRNGKHRTEFIEKMKLTKREVEIICMIARGGSGDEIAEKLFVSEHTIRTHKKNILKKLSLGKTTDLVRFAFENHML